MTRITIAILISIFILLASACSEQKTRSHLKIIEVYRGIESTNNGDNSFYGAELNIGSRKFSRFHGAVYDEKGCLKKYIRYLPEGLLEYTAEEISLDIAIIQGVGLPFCHRWRIENGSLKTLENGVLSDIDLGDGTQLGIEQVNTQFWSSKDWGLAAREGWVLLYKTR